jgi:putative copper resistance protein D
MTQLLDIFGFLSVVLRGLTLALQSMVGGGLVFALWVDRGEAGPAAVRAWRRLLVASACGLALVEAGYVAADTALLMGTANLRLAEVVGANFFVAGTAAAALALAVAALAGSVARPARAAAAALLPALGILATSVATSHAAARLDDRALPLALTALHHAATACWIGGLPYLLLSLPRAGDAAVAQRLSARFSRLAQASVAVLVGAGIGLAVIYVGTPAAILGTAYGAMVSAKVALLVLLLGLGALNYSIAHGVQAGDGTVLSRLRRYAEAEVGIGFTVILAAASLTSQPPAADVLRDLVPLREIAARMTPRAPRLVPPSTRDMISPSLRAAAEASFAEASGGAAGSASNAGTAAGSAAAGSGNGAAAGAGGATGAAVAAGRGTAADAYASFVPGQINEPRTAGEIALSEFNHNVSGLVVLLAGVLAVAARAGWRWARNWPLAFLGLAVFLFLLADAEYWPMGPVPFWRGFLVSEALQHRFAVLLIVAFAVFERQVQTGRATWPAAALVFPFVCFLGGALLLTHSHSLNNPQSELLADLSHVPIAIFGIAAGWSRWLELRLDGGPRRALSWIWPICLMLVGLVLLDYRES